MILHEDNKYYNGRNFMYPISYLESYNETLSIQMIDLDITWKGSHYLQLKVKIYFVSHTIIR